MPSYEEHCRTLGKLAATLVDVVGETLPLQTFKESIDSKSRRLLQNADDELTCIGNDGLSIVQRSQRPPCAILLGTSSAGKTEILGSFLPQLRQFAGSTAADTTPMLVRMRYPKDLNKMADHGKVTLLMPRDLAKLMSSLGPVREAIHEDTQLAETWDKVQKMQRQDVKKDEAYEKRLFAAINDWVREAYQWARVSGEDEDGEYFETLQKITEYFDPDSKLLDSYNPIPRSLLIGFLDKGKDDKKLAKILEEKQNKSHQEALSIGEKYYFMRTAGAITDLFVEEDILKDIDIFDTAGVRVGGAKAERLKPSDMVHSQFQAFKNRWGFERLVPSVDIIIFILVLEEQQVDTEFQELFEECAKYGNLKNRLFIFLNKLDKAVTQAINKGDYTEKGKEIIPNEDETWKLWIQTNVMDKIDGLGEDFRNVFLCHAPKFKIEGKKEVKFLEASMNSPILSRYLYNPRKNIKGALKDDDGGIKYAWRTVERIMRDKGTQIRFERLAQQILPLNKDVRTVLGAKRVVEEKPSDKDIDAYLEKLLKDLEDLNWRNEEFRLPERFGEFCIYKGFCTSKQVDIALKEQQNMENETGKRIRLGQILVDRKFLSLEQVREVLQAAESEEEDWDTCQEETFKHVRKRVTEQIVSFMEEKNRPIIHGNIPVEAVINYLTEPINALESELRGIYSNKERKAFQEAVQSVMECQLLAGLWNQERLRKHLWAQKPKITSSFHIRDDISKEEAIKVTECYDKLQELFDKLPTEKEKE